MKIIDIHSHLYHPDWYPLQFQYQIAINSLKGKKNNSLDKKAVLKQTKILNRALSDKSG